MEEVPVYLRLAASLRGAGLGVDIDGELAARYPYKRAYLPVIGSKTAR
jgi:hypothetical protein